MGGGEMISENKPRPPFLQFFVNHPVVGMVCFLAALVTIATTAYLLVIGRETRNLFYYCNPIKTSIVQAGNIKTLEVFHNGQKIETDVTAMQVAIWNKGRLPILKSDVLEDCVLLLEPPVRILDAEVTKQSRSLVNLTLSKDFLNQGRIPLTWKILEHNDGGVIQLIFSGNANTDIEIQGSIIGQASIHKMRSPDKLTNLSAKEASQAGIAFLILAFLGLFFCIVHLIPEKWINEAKGKRSDRPNKISKSEIRRATVYLIEGIICFFLFLIVHRNGPPFGF
jgi:hypothetical protein